MRGIGILHGGRMTLLVLALLIFNGCASQQGMFDKAREADSIEAYEEFLAKYPTGELSGQASDAIETLVYRDCSAEDTPDAYEGYLRSYPQGAHRNEALSRMEDLAYDIARTADTPAAYEDFLKDFPASVRTMDVERRIMSLDLDTLLKRADARSCDEFVRRYGQKEYASDAIREVRERKEQLIYEAAATSTSIDAAIEYLSAYPEGRYREELKQAILRRGLAHPCPGKALLVMIPKITKFHEVVLPGGEVDKPSGREMFLTLEIRFVNMGEPLALSHEDISVVSGDSYEWHPQWAFGFGWYEYLPGMSKRIMGPSGDPGGITIGRSSTISLKAVAKSRDFNKVYLHLYGKRVGSLEELATEIH